MGSDVADAELIRLSVADASLFGVVYERHVVSIGRYVVRRVGGGMAEDLTAEVFVRAFRGRATYVASYSTALPWLLGIANNLVADHRRAERRRLAAFERLAQVAPRSVIEGERLGLTPELARALRNLPPVERDTLLLVVWGELSYAEAAFALSVPVGTVRSRIARARQRLTKAVEAEWCPTLRTEHA